MLCRKVVGHQGIVEYRQAHNAFLAGPWKYAPRRHDNSKASKRYQQRNYDESSGLAVKERSVGFCAVGKPSAAQTMTDPEQGAQRQVDEIKRATLRIRITVGQPDDQGQEPERVQHPHAVPNWATHPGSVPSCVHKVPRVRRTYRREKPASGTEGAMHLTLILRFPQKIENWSFSQPM